MTVIVLSSLLVMLRNNKVQPFQVMFSLYLPEFAEFASEVGFVGRLVENWSDSDTVRVRDFCCSPVMDYLNNKLNYDNIKLI